MHRKLSMRVVNVSDYLNATLVFSIHNVFIICVHNYLHFSRNMLEIKKMCTGMCFYFFCAVPHVKGGREGGREGAPVCVCVCALVRVCQHCVCVRCCKDREKDRPLKTSQ